MICRDAWFFCFLPSQPLPGAGHCGKTGRASGLLLIASGENLFARNSMVVAFLSLRVCSDRSDFSPKSNGCGPFHGWAAA